MPIRIKHLDNKVGGILGKHTADLGDVTATRTYTVFVAPVACVIDFVDIYSNEANPPAGTTASTTNFSATVRAIINGTASVLTTRGTSATQITTNSISANVPYRLTPTANNSLTVGTPLQLVATVGGSGTLSGACVHVTYTPLVHRETR